MRSPSDRNGLLHAGLLCLAPGEWAMQLRDCHEALHFPFTGISPTMLGHVWLQGMKAVFKHQPPSPPAHGLLHPMCHKKAIKRTWMSATGDAYVVGGYRDQHRTPDPDRVPWDIHAFRSPGLLDVPIGGCLQRTWTARGPSVGASLTPHAGGGVNPRHCEWSTACQHSARHARQYGDMWGGP